MAQPNPAFVYKILSAAPPAPLTSSRPLVTPLDEKDGFTPKTLARFYGNDESVWIVKIPATSAFLAASKWDPSSTGELFLHLYGEVAVQEEDGWTVRQVVRGKNDDWVKTLEGASWLE